MAVNLLFFLGLLSHPGLARISPTKDLAQLSANGMPTFWGRWSWTENPSSATTY
jgi:hypothetical protein